MADNAGHAVEGPRDKFLYEEAVVVTGHLPAKPTRVGAHEAVTRVVVGVPKDDAKPVTSRAKSGKPLLDESSPYASPLLRGQHCHRSEPDADGAAGVGVDEDR